LRKTAGPGLILTPGSWSAGVSRNRHLRARIRHDHGGPPGL